MKNDYTHNLLNLKNVFHTEKNKSGYSRRELKNNQGFSIEQIKKLISQLESIKEFWLEDEKILKNEEIITSVGTKVLAKSNRVMELFIPNLENVNAAYTSSDPNFYIVGVKIVKEKHVITYSLPKGTLQKAIDKLKRLISFLDKNNINFVDNSTIEFGCKKESILKKYNFNKTNFANLIVDVYYIDSFELEDNKEVFNYLRSEENKNTSKIVTFYKTGRDINDILSEIGIKINLSNKIDALSFCFSSIEDIDLIESKIPYLVSMSIVDVFKTDDVKTQKLDDEQYLSEENIFLVNSLPNPTNEPIVGVIDTFYKENKQCQLSKWIESVNMLNINQNDNYYTDADFDHAMNVSSLIVCGNKLNPRLEDNCGFFKVKHFGIFSNGGLISKAYKDIEEIVIKNREIKVWNISFGEHREIRQNSISLLASLLDNLSNKYDIIFVVCGTNDKNESLNSPENNLKAIGSPADSINSIVVNSVDFQNKPAEYSRVGPVLNFYKKPDLAYYGGTIQEPILAIDVHGHEVYRRGTSFSTPFITRKIAFMIYKLGLSKEVAKALLLCSCKLEENDDPKLLGYGVPPIKIEEIVKAKSDEILFYIDGYSEEFKTYNYDIPFPTQDNKLPYSFTTFLVYFPQTIRNQGVDYSNEELEFSFGRKNVNTGELVSLNKGENKFINNKWLTEEELRNNNKKWDNVKFIKEKLTSKTRPKTNFGEETGYYGFSIRKFRRNNFLPNKPIKFGMVVKVKCIDQKDRYDRFKELCRLKGWVINEIDIDLTNRINAILNDDIEFN